MRRRPRIALALAAALAVAASPLAAQVWAGGRLRIVAPNPEDVDFGRAVAVLDFDGDGDLEIAIGDPSTDKVEDAPLPAVRLYHRTGAGWEEWISARIGAVWFGTVLAVGDFNEDDRQDLLIGAPGDSNGGGAVYWWHKTESGSSFGSVLTTVGAADGGCGSSLAVGDFDGDDHLDFATGCPRASFDDYDAVGRVEIAYGDGTFSTGTFFHQASADVEGSPETGDEFGAALAAGDFRCDGVDDLAVGAPGEDVDGGTDTGAIHVLPGSDTGLTGTDSQLWHQGTTGVPGASGDGDRFGAALAAGDFDRGLAGPYCEALAIGVPDDAGNPGGAVVVLHESDTGLTATGAKLFTVASFGPPSNPGADHHFGFSLAAGQIDGDYDDELVVGARGDVGFPTALAGSACVLYGTPEGPSGEGAICFAGSSNEFVEGALPDGDREFGTALAIGPLDGEDGAELVLGSPGFREVFVLESALFADGFELGSTGRWPFAFDD